MHQESSVDNVLFTYEQLHAVDARLPLLSGGIPICESRTAGRAVPWLSLIVYQLAAAEPESGPLRAGKHPIVGEYSVDVPDGILEDGCRPYRGIGAASCGENEG